MQRAAPSGVRHRLGTERLLVAAGLAGFVLVVYVVVVLGGGAVLGRTGSPSLVLSVLATTVVAVLFAPVQAALERKAADRRPGGATTPYEVLTRFTEAVTAGDAADGVPARMAMLLARGTGARWAQVWLSVSGTLTLAATWPPDAGTDPAPPALEPEEGADVGAATPGGRRSLPVRHGSTVLGVLRLQERAGQPLSGVEERLFSGLAAQAGLVLRLVGLQAELELRREQLLSRAEELHASRDRLVQAQDAERRRLERDLHDGAQQHLVALAVNLRLAQTVAGRSPERAARILAGQAAAATEAIDTLSSLSRGIYPRLLTEQGLVPALQSAVAVGALPVSVEGGSRARPPSAVEAALYFCGMEAVQNAGKHSRGHRIVVRFDEDGTAWRLTVADDGAGFDPPGAAALGRGAGLSNMHDRIDAVGGTVRIDAPAGRGTTVVATVPRQQDARQQDADRRQHAPRQQDAARPPDVAPASGHLPHPGS